MLDKEKLKIRELIENQRVADINDETAVKLRELAETSELNKNFRISIACKEIIVDDLGYDNPNAFSGKVSLLLAYCTCGYADSKEALELALNLLAELPENEVFPPIYSPASLVLYLSNDKKHKAMATELAEKLMYYGIDLVKRGVSNDDVYLCISEGGKMLSKIYLKENKFSKLAEIYDLIFDYVDGIGLSLLSVIELYHMNGASGNCGDVFRYIKESEVPEAKYILGIMYAEGHLVPKNVTLAKGYFQQGDILAEKLKGTVGYTDFDFSVFSNMSKEKIIEVAGSGEYHSKFFYAIRKEDSSNTKQINTNAPLNTNTEKSSGGCYVATCVYGSYDCPEVWTLRRFRDNILSEHLMGRLFIKCYYAISPTAVKLFGNYLWFHKLFKAPLDKLVGKLIANGVDNTPYNDR